MVRVVEEKKGILLLVVDELGVCVGPGILITRVRFCRVGPGASPVGGFVFIT